MRELLTEEIEDDLESLIPFIKIAWKKGGNQRRYALLTVNHPVSFLELSSPNFDGT